jgi:polysaccharide export outer membrane protein
MTTRCQGRLLRGLGTTLLLCMASTGCQSFGLDNSQKSQSLSKAAQAPDSSVIYPRSLIQWTIEAEEGPQGKLMTGQGIVGPEGMLELGPYGSVKVGQLTPQQARGVIEKHLSKFLKNPKVSVHSAGEQLARNEGQNPAKEFIPVQRPSDRSENEVALPKTEGKQTSRNGEIQSKGQAQKETGARISQWRAIQRSGDSEPISLAGWQTGAPPALAEGVVTAGLQPVLQQQETAPQPKLAPQAADTQEPPALKSETVHTPSVPNESAKVPLTPYVIEAPDILLIESTQKLPDQPIRGQHLVRPDGTVNMGIYGSTLVAGMTLDQAKEAVGRVLGTRIKDFDTRNLNVDVLAYNSKFYYVITDGGGYGEQVVRFPITGNETVLDGISQIYGLPAVASKKHIWVARRPNESGPEQILAVDWIGISQRGSTATNYQILPGDRIYVNADHWVKFDSKVAKVLSPFERIFGFTLLGSETVNSIMGRNVNGFGR